MSSIACVFAHPDDEAFGPGGTIAKLSTDHDVYLICCTDGDHRRSGLKHIRDKELLASAKILGVKQVFFLNFVDGELSNNKYHLLSSSIRSILDQLRPHTIITFAPNGVSGHIDHITVTSIVNWLFTRLSYLKKVMYFCLSDAQRSAEGDGYFVYMPPGHSRSDIDIVIDVSSVWDTKVSAMRSHTSQQADCDRLLQLLASLPKEEYFLVRSKR